MSKQPSRPSASRRKRIVNNGDWWVAVLIERFELHDADRKNDRRLERVWENTVIFNAPDAASAYEKAVSFGKLCDDDKTIHDDQGRRYRHVFVGLSALLPLYEDIEDEAEIMWTDHGVISVRRAQRMVKTRKALLTRFTAVK